MIKYSFFALSFALSLLVFTGTADASGQRLIGTYGGWSAYVFTEDDHNVCYMASRPEKAEGDYSKRGDIYAFITHRPAEGTKNVFSYMTGYPYKEGSNATLEIGNDSFTLFTQDETAWAPDSETDNKISESIKRGIKMVIRGTSGRGTVTTDTFSLKGSTAAHNAISRECGIKK